MVAAEYVNRAVAAAFAAAFAGKPDLAQAAAQGHARFRVGGDAIYQRGAISIRHDRLARRRNSGSSTTACKLAMRWIYVSVTYESMAHM